jgi:hypothetical protein
MNRRLLMSIFLLTTACACHGSIARASLIVTVGDLNLREGGSGFVDVMIRSSDGSDLALLDLFAIDLLISPGAASQLEFVDLGGGIPSDTHLTDPDYLFAADGVGFGGGLLSSTLYSGGDGTSSGDGVFVPAVDTLLVRLEVTAATLSPPVAGEFTGGAPNGDHRLIAEIPIGMVGTWAMCSQDPDAPAPPMDSLENLKSTPK